MHIVSCKTVSSSGMGLILYSSVSCIFAFLFLFVILCLSKDTPFDVNWCPIPVNMQRLGYEITTLTKMIHEITTTLYM